MRLRKLLILLLFITTNCWAGTIVDYNDANCQAAWLMDADIDPIPDSSQNSNTGAKVGTPTFSTTSPPDTYSTGYFEFDGTSDYFNCGSGIDMAGWTALTIVCWLDWDSSGSDEHGIVSNWATNVAGVLIRLEEGNDTIEGHVVEESNTTVPAFGNAFNSTIAVNEWEHLAITWDTTNGLQAYLNGDLDATSFASSAALDSNSSDILYLAVSPNNFADKLTGKLDEVAIFDRALNITEIQDIMDNGLSPISVAAPQVIFINEN